MPNYFIILLAFLMLFVAWRFYFLRNPKRIIPKGNHIVSPADGTVLYIKRIEKGSIPAAQKNGIMILLNEITDYTDLQNISGYLVGIFMTPLSVHRNRIPVSGKIVDVKYRPKPNNLSMVQATTDVLIKRKSFPDYDFYPTNERLTIFIKTNRGIVAVTQIADKWIRKIVNWSEVGDEVTMGEQYGMIRFGSQCDIFIPESISIEFTVKAGEYVYAGKTILGTIADSN